MTHKEYAESLRLIADFFEAHEELALPQSPEEFKYYSACGKAQMAAVAKALGTCQKEFHEEWFDLVKQFGTINFCARDYRNRICEAVVVGKKLVPETIIPGRPSEIVPEHEEDIIKWRCDEPLLEKNADA